MPTVMAVDPFIEAVEAARRSLTRRRGVEYTNADLVRDTGINKSTLYYHLNPRIERQGGHTVPDEIIRKLAAVLPISEDELRDAARVAAGYQVEGNVTGDRDYGYEVARFLDSDDVSEADKAELAVRLQQILTEHWTRDVQNRRRDGK
jgi:DNA-binding transcriptional ArsR family regulator